MGINEQDLRKIHDEQYAKLLNYATSIVRNREDAREIVQDVFLALWKNRGHLDLDRNIPAYLMRSIKNRCINNLKSARKKYSHKDIDTVHLTSDDSIEKDIYAAELKVKIYDCIDKLPPRCKEIFMNSRFEQLSYKEIAEKMNLSVKTIENQITIALRKIRASMAKKE